MEIKEKKNYIKAWKSHIDTLYTLCLTPSRKLSDEVRDTIAKLKELVVQVAEDKIKGVI